MANGLTPAKGGISWEKIAVLVAKISANIRRSTILMRTKIIPFSKEIELKITPYYVLSLPRMIKISPSLGLSSPSGKPVMVAFKTSATFLA